MFVDDFVSVPVRYSVRGITEGKVDIVLTYDGREVAAKRDIPVKEGDDLKEVLTFVPLKADAAVKKQELTATITVTSTSGVAVEPLTDTMTKPSQVVDKKLKVLVVDSLPRYDFKYLQRALLRDRRVEAKFYLTEGDKPAMRSGPPWLTEFSRELNGTLNLDRDEFRKILFDFDLVILGDVPKRFFSREQQQIIKEFVTEGGGLIQIAGRWHAPAGWADEKDTAEDRQEPDRRVAAGRVGARFVSRFKNPARRSDTFRSSRRPRLAARFARSKTTRSTTRISGARRARKPTCRARSNSSRCTGTTR